MLAIGGAAGKSTNPDLALVELIFEFLTNSVESLRSDWKNTSVLLFYLCKCFSSFPSISFQRVLIMDYIHTFVFVHKSPNFPLLCFKKPSSKRSEGFCWGKYVYFLTEGNVHHQSPCSNEEGYSTFNCQQLSGFDIQCEWHMGCNPVWEVPKLRHDRLLKDKKMIWVPNHLVVNFTQKKQRIKMVSQVPSECEMNKNVCLYSWRVTCELKI